MSFGGFAPLPIRLGGGPTDGWTAAQHARAAADLQALALTSDYAVLTVNKSGGTVTVEHYLGQDGVGVGAAPLALSGGTGIIQLVWPASYTNDYEETEPLAFQWADPGIIGSSNMTASATVSSNTVNVFMYNAASGALTDGRVTVTVGPGVFFDRRIGDYDGALDKRDSQTEGAIPYAWSWYQEYEAMLGSAFTKERSGLVHAKKLALARREAAITRLAEKFKANTKPGTADEALDAWVKLLNVRVRPGDTKQDIRQRCAVRLLASRGPTMTRVDEAVAELLGEAFVKVWRRYGSDLATPPPQTYWPGVNPGTSDYSLGGGAWFSERAHLVVEVDPPAAQSEAEFLHLANVELFRMLDELSPAWATFDWATGLVDGFLLDISQLDYGGLTE